MAADPNEIPLFPLPGVTLFPLATLPLFVFEPRYRQMMADVLDRNPQRIGMVAVAEAHLDEIGGDPPVARVGCEGEVTAAERNPDGTYRVLLRGTRRFRILEESPPDELRPYRLARVETLPEVFEDDDRNAIRAERGAMLALLSDLIRRTAPQHAGAFRADRFEGVGEVQLVNTLAQSIDLDLHDKQQLLELDRVCDRQRMLCDLMRFRIAEIEGGSGFGPTTVQ